jgi:hypothetical protein
MIPIKASNSASAAAAAAGDIGGVAGEDMAEGQ